MVFNILTSCAIITRIHFRTFSLPPKETWHPLAITSLSLHPSQPLATTNLFSVSMDLPILEISYKWNHREFPGGPVVRILRFHCRGHGFNSWAREIRSCKPQGAAKIKRNHRLCARWSLCLARFVHVVAWIRTSFLFFSFFFFKVNTVLFCFVLKVLFIYLFIYLFYGCVGSSFLREGFL